MRGGTNALKMHLLLQMRLSGKFQPMLLSEMRQAVPVFILRILLDGLFICSLCIFCLHWIPHSCEAFLFYASFALQG